MQQNGLFGSVLRSLGFDVIDAAARVVQSGDDEPGEVEEAPPLPSRSKSGALGINDVKPQVGLGVRQRCGWVGMVKQGH